MKSITATAYTLKCVATNREFEDAGWLLEDSQSDEPSLVRAVYKNKQLELKGDEYGLYTFCD